MPIIKKVLDTNYTKVWNGMLQNPEMSLGAKGLLCYMLSLPNDWKFTIAGLATNLKETEKTIIKLLKELEQFGYHTKKHIYENGRIKEWEYYVYMEPQQEIINKCLEKNKIVENNNVVFEDVENQHCCFPGDIQTISKDIVNNINKENNINKCGVDYVNLKNKNYFFTKKAETIKAKTIKATTIKAKTIQAKTIYGTDLGKVDHSDRKDNRKNVENVDKVLLENVNSIVEYLNELCNKRFRPNNSNTINLISARLSEGYKLEDFYLVIDKKWKEWQNTDMEKFIQPSTLFADNHFEDYLNQKINTSSFDNTTTHQVPKGVSDMNDQEKQEFFENELAKDENGNYLQF